MRLGITCLITAAFGATQSFGALYDGPAEVLNSTYDFIVVGGMPSRRFIVGVAYPGLRSWRWWRRNGLPAVRGSQYSRSTDRGWREVRGSSCVR